MAKTALVTGGTGRARDVAGALGAAGFEVLEADGAEEVDDVVHRAGRSPLDAYVQLPVEVDADGPTVTAQMAALLEQGLVARFRTAGAVAPLLAPGARVVLVPGNLPPTLTAPDDHVARLALLGVLAHALRADCAPGRLSVVVASGQHSPEALARLATGASVPHPPLPDYAALWPEMSYDEWRLAVLGLGTLEG